MKKLIALILALTLAASLFVGCGSKTPEVPDNDPVTTPTDTADPTDTVDPTDAPDSTDAPEIPAAPSESTPENEPEQNPDEYIPPKPEDTLVSEFVISYETVNFIGKYNIPQMNIQSADAERVNKEIIEKYVLQFNWLDEDSLCNVNWELERWGDIVSLVITESMNYEWQEYNAYTFDLSTGKELSEEEILALKGLDKETFNEKVLEAADAFFCEYYESFEEFTGFAIGRAENLELNVRYIYIDSTGAICVVREITSMAGADGYYFRTFPVC